MNYNIFGGTLNLAQSKPMCKAYATLAIISGATQLDSRQSNMESLVTSSKPCQ